MTRQPLVHGTDYAYEYWNCRCRPCRDAHNRRTKANRAARLAAGRLNHGTRSAYDAGCRCEPCRERRREAHRSAA